MELEDFTARAESADRKIAALTERCEKLEQEVSKLSTIDKDTGNSDYIIPYTTRHVLRIHVQLQKKKKIV